MICIQPNHFQCLSVRSSTSHSASVSNLSWSEFQGIRSLYRERRVWGGNTSWKGFQSIAENCAHTFRPSFTPKDSDSTHIFLAGGNKQGSILYEVQFMRRECRNSTLCIIISLRKKYAELFRTVMVCSKAEKSILAWNELGYLRGIFSLVIFIKLMILVMRPSLRIYQVLLPSFPECHWKANPAGGVHVSTGDHSTAGFLQIFITALST